MRTGQQTHLCYLYTSVAVGLTSQAHVLSSHTLYNYVPGLQFHKVQILPTSASIVFIMHRNAAITKLLLTSTFHSLRNVKRSYGQIRPTGTVYSPHILT